MKKTIRLTEGRLRRMIREAVQAEMNNGGINNAELEERLANGEDPRDVFDWFGLYNDYAQVKLNDKYNFINTEGRIISDTWFDYIGYFHDGFAKVGLNHKYNYINTEGQLISDTWFDNAEDFDEGYGDVKLNGEWYEINNKGEIFKYDFKPTRLLCR